jgi:hypothetical protein
MRSAESKMLDDEVDGGLIERREAAAGLREE